MQKWILPTLSEVFAASEPSLANRAGDDVTAQAIGILSSESKAILPANSRNHDTFFKRLKAEREWTGAIAAVEQLLLENINTEASAGIQGIMLAGPVPVLSHQAVLTSLQTAVFTAELSQLKTRKLFQLPPAETSPATDEQTPKPGLVIPLLMEDPLAIEQFCLILTTKFSLLLVLGRDVTGMPTFMFSFEPQLMEQAWQSLRSRAMLTSSQDLVLQLDALVEQYDLITPNYRTVTQFSRLLLNHLPQPEEIKGLKPGHKEEGEVTASSYHSYQALDYSPSSRPDVELLQAFAHEVRTPLTTIRTLIRLLLKRRDLATDVLKRLETIEQECLSQINRMELLFRAAELETSKVKSCGAYLTTMSLEQVLQQNIPRWQQSATRRNLTLDVLLPQQLPTVVSDPKMLDQVLTGLIDNFTRSLPAGSHIQVQVIPAGEQLKLQLLSHLQTEQSCKEPESLPVAPIKKSLGQLLMFQPETGNISLNLNATKHLFQAIGGKLIVRQRPHQGEVLTIFLPLEAKCFVQEARNRE